MHGVHGHIVPPYLLGSGGAVGATAPAQGNIRKQGRGPPVETLCEAYVASGWTLERYQGGGKGQEYSPCVALQHVWRRGGTLHHLHWLRMQRQTRVALWQVPWLAHFA